MHQFVKKMNNNFKCYNFNGILNQILVIKISIYEFYFKVISLIVFLIILHENKTAGIKLLLF